MNRQWCLLLVLTLALVMGGCSGSNSLENLRTQGQEALEKREYARARGFFGQALELDARDMESLVGMAQAYRSDSRYDSAIYYFKRADLMHPKDREILQQIREVAIALGDWQNAINAIESMIRLGDPKDMWHEQLAVLWPKNGEPGRGFFHARRAIVYGTDDPAIYLQAANGATKYDSTEVALGLYDAAIAKFGPLDPFMVNKALLLSSIGQPRQAEALMREVVARQNPPAANMRFALAGILAGQPQRSKKMEALALYREIGQLHPGEYPTDTLISILNAELE